jgi:hypothetical protein
MAWPENAAFDVSPVISWILAGDSGRVRMRHCRGQLSSTAHGSFFADSGSGVGGVALLSPNEHFTFRFKRSSKIVVSGEAYLSMLRGLAEEGEQVPIIGGTFECIPNRFYY